LPKWLGEICGLAFKLISMTGLYHVPLYMACDIKKAKEIINYKPQIETEEGIKKDCEISYAREILLNMY
jgi:nucleoside-diphosphate-sugar epimerase